MHRIIRDMFRGAMTIILAMALWTTVHAQTSYVRTTVMPNQANIPCVEERGMIKLTANGKGYDKRYLLRYPEPSVQQWNRKLLIAAHGGGGGVRYSRTGSFMETSETALDDVVGMYALNHGYAYASVDRDGIGGTPEGLGLTYAFTSWVRERLRAVYGQDASHVYLAGLSIGGAISRYAAEDTDPKYDGVLLIAAGGGATLPQFERQAKLVTLWPEVDPARHPNLPLTNASIVAYAKEVGTPTDARRFWPYVGAGQSLAGFKRSLEGYGLMGLTDKQLQDFRMKQHQKNTAFMERVAKTQAANTTGKITIPTIEVAGTYDDIVMAGILEYKNKVKNVSMKTAGPKPTEMHRLYQVTGAWHISPDDDAMQAFQYSMNQMGLSEEAQTQLATGESYIPTVQKAFDYLDRWVTKGQTPPADQTVQAKEELK